MRGMLGALAAMALGMGSIIQPDRARGAEVVRTEPRRRSPDRRQRDRAIAEAKLRTREHVQGPETRQQRRARERRDRKNLPKLPKGQF
jgi:hypothetical protein